MSVKILDVLLQTAYNLPENKVATLYKVDEATGQATDELVDNAEQILLQWDAERIAGLQKADVNTTEIYDKAARETQARIEKRHESRLRALFPAVDPKGELKGEALEAAIKTAMAATKTYDPAQIKQTDEYLALERQMNEALQQKDEEYNSRIKEVETTYQKQQTWTEKEKLIRAAFKKLNPILPKDPEKALSHENDFVEKFKGYEWQQTEDGKILPLQNGQRINSTHGHALYLEDLVRVVASRSYEFEKQEQTANIGNENGGDKKPVIVIKDENDFVEQYNNAGTFEEKQVIAAAWEAQAQG